MTDGAGRSFFYLPGNAMERHGSTERPESGEIWSIFFRINNLYKPSEYDPHS